MMEDEQPDLPGVEKPTLIEAVYGVTGSKFERVVVIGLSAAGAHVISEGHVYQTDIPGLIDMGGEIIKKRMLKQLYAKNPPAPSLREAAGAAEGE